MFVYPLSAAHTATRPISKRCPFFLRMNSAPGMTLTSSSQNSNVNLDDLNEVVMRTLGGIEGSLSKAEAKYEANGSEEMSKSDSSVGFSLEFEARVLD